MKKTIRPSPLLLIITGFATVLGVVAAVIEISSSGSLGSEGVITGIIVVGAFVWQLVKFLSRSKVEFDESTFTVDGTEYRYSDITKAEADSVQVIRGFSTLRIDVYIDNEFTFDFQKNENGAEDFIACMKKHGIIVTVID